MRAPEAMSAATQQETQPATLALFVSDVHLHPSLPRTTARFFDFLQRHAPRARQLYLLGDLFESWAGDDDLDDPYNAQVVKALRMVADAGVDVYWMAGNRDFLAGPEFARAAGLTLLPDPFVTDIAGRRIALTHGDAQCTDDTGYMAFRAKVRESAWQHEFLAMPLAQRKALIAGMREGSRAAQRAKSNEIMDVNAGAIEELFGTTGASVIIHGHTHRPANHAHGGDNRIRHVLPDWDCDLDPMRGGWLALDAHGRIRRYRADGSETS